MLTEGQIINFFSRGSIIKGDNQLQIYNETNGKLYPISTILQEKDNVYSGTYNIDSDSNNFLFLPYIEMQENQIELNPINPLFLTSTLEGCLLLVFLDEDNRIQAVHSNCYLNDGRSKKQSDKTIRFRIIYKLNGKIEVEKLASDGKKFNTILVMNTILYCCSPKAFTEWKEEVASCCGTRVSLKTIGASFDSYDVLNHKCNVVGQYNTQNRKWIFKAVSYVG